MKKEAPSAAMRAEAAAWIARLHGPNRTPEVEAGFRQWISEDPQRASAFELLTDTWEKSARLRRRPLEEVASWERPGFRMSFSRAALATAAVTVLAVIGTLFFLRGNGVATQVGEQRTLVLEDGSRVHLNTDSQAVVQYDSNARRIELRKGEAFFEVARRPDWPFIVVAGNREIRALGTSFVVRHDAESFAVTLVEGKVAVSTVPVSDVSGLPDSQSEASPDLLNKPTASKAATTFARKRESNEASTDGTSNIFTLRPGERLTVAGTAAPKVDKPAIDKVTAWQRGQVALDNTPLAEAVVEMNRYSRVRLVIENPRVAAIPVSGIFRAGDSEHFAEAVAKTYRLQVIVGREEIVLAEPVTVPGSGSTGLSTSSSQSNGG